jgi:hypothetical protein
MITGKKNMRGSLDEDRSESREALACLAWSLETSGQKKGAQVEPARFAGIRTLGSGWNESVLIQIQIQIQWVFA